MHQRKVSIHLIQVVKSAFQPAVFTGKKTNLVQQAMHQSHPKASPHPFLLDGSLCTPGVEWMLRKLMHVRCFHTSASNYETAESQPRHQVKKNLLSARAAHQKTMTNFHSERKRVQNWFCVRNLACWTETAHGWDSYYAIAQRKKKLKINWISEKLIKQTWLSRPMMSFYGKVCII